MSSTDTDVESVGRLNRDDPAAISKVITFEHGQLAFINNQDGWLTSEHPWNLREWA